MTPAPRRPLASPGLCRAVLLALLPVALSSQPLPAPPGSPAPGALAQPWPGLDGYLLKQVNPATDLVLRGCFRGLYEDSSRFRALVEAFWREQPKMRLTLMPLTELDPALRPKKSEAACYGMLYIQPTPGGYDVIVAVQTELVQAGQDLAEPWLAQMIFALLEISRRDAVVRVGKRLAVNMEVQQRMWDFQRQLRSELKAGHAEKYKAMAYDGEYLFKVKLL